MYPTAKIAVPVEIKLSDAQIGDTLRVTYLESTDVNIPESSYTEITYTGVVFRLTDNGKNAGLPIIRVRSHNEGRWGHGQGYTELSLANAYTIPPTTVMLLNRPEKPFELGDREYYVTGRNLDDRVFRISVTDGKATGVFFYYYPTPKWIEDRDVSLDVATENLIDALTKDDSGWVHVAQDDLPRFIMEPGVEYTARTRNAKKAQSIRFNSTTEWETLEDVDPSEVLTGIGNWHYPEAFVHPRQHIFDRVKEMGITTGRVYEGFGTGRYQIDPDAHVLHAAVHYNKYFRRTQQDTMEVLDAIERGTLQLVKP